jgi:anti-sigma factor RsiW
MASLNDKDRAELVAYLDGELDEQSAKSLEAKLSLDPAARQEAVALQKTWELLDYLPRPEPSPNFTHRTMERLSGQLPAVSSVRARGRWPGWVIAAGWAAALLLAAGVGFGAVTFLAQSDKDRSPDPLAQLEPAEVEQNLVRNLRLLENQRLYENVDDIDFLRTLDNPELFGDGDATN